MMAEHELEQRDFIVKLRRGIVSHKILSFKRVAILVVGYTIMYNTLRSLQTLQSSTFSSLHMENCTVHLGKK